MGSISEVKIAINFYTYRYRLIEWNLNWSFKLGIKRWKMDKLILALVYVVMPLSPPSGPLPPFLPPPLIPPDISTGWWYSASPVQPLSSSWSLLRSSQVPRRPAGSEDGAHSLPGAEPGQSKRLRRAQEGAECHKNGGIFNRQFIC